MSSDMVRNASRNFETASVVFDLVRKPSDDSSAHTPVEHSQNSWSLPKCRIRVDIARSCKHQARWLSAPLVTSSSKPQGFPSATNTSPNDNPSLILYGSLISLAR